MTNRTRGFTLLETVVALAILALALMAIFDINSGAVSNHAYAKKLTVATLLARSKMTDLEQKLYDEGFSNDDAEESGDFSQDGWDNFKWRAKIIAPKTDGVSPEQLIGAIFNLPIGEGGDLSGIASMFGGGGAAGGKDGKGGSSQTTANPMAGAAMGMAQPMFTQMVQQITQTVREVHLTVYWKDGTQVESLDLVTHVVSLGPGSDRNGGFQPNNGTQPAELANQWVDPASGQLVQGVPGANGQMMNPQTGQPLMRRSDWLQQRGGGTGGVVPGGGITGGPFGNFGKGLGK